MQSLQLPLTTGFHGLSEEGKTSDTAQASTVSLYRNLVTVDKMRSVVFVVVIVLWAVIEINGEYSFGDIISFQRNCPCIRPLTYKHFAIYVGNKEIKYKESDKDIFQRTGPVKPFSLRRLSDCIFSKLEDERQPSIFGGMNVEKKDNYLDGFANFTVGSEDQIIERITETHKNCSQYEPRSNNCEHLATYIRYGEKLSLQPDLSTRCLKSGVGESELVSSAQLNRAVEMAKIVAGQWDSRPSTVHVHPTFFSAGGGK
ncbi:hypothetical protein Q8A73_007483 [Channa argus]|nr:hypothetical protein Q8A73_007483 [Channa argus]